MTRRLKPIPKNAEEISQEQFVPYLNALGKPVSDTIFTKNRAKDISLKDDTTKNISVGLEDLDYAILYYFENIIKPNVIQNGQRIPVPILYGSPERWKSMQADGFYRDLNGRLMTPLIMFKRENIEKNRTLGNKLDGNKVHLYQVVGTKYNIRNAYDKFSLVNNRIPSEQYYITAVPDYVTLTYTCVVFTSFVEQNNKLIEAIEFASDSYWGDPNRWKFKARIDNFATTTELEEGTDRSVKTTFNIILNGYIISDAINKDLATASRKFYTKSQIVFDLESIDGNVTNKLYPMPGRTNATNSTSFVGGGTNITQQIILGGANINDVIYINTNITKIANLNTPPNISTFYSSSIYQPASGSALPPTTVNNFTFFINGQYVPPSVITLSENSGNVIANFNTSSLGYSLDATDEVVAIGKFTP